MQRKKISREDLEIAINNLMNDKDGILFLQWLFQRTYIFNTNKGRDLREFAQKSGVNEIGYEVLHICEKCDIEKVYTIIKDMRELHDDNDN